MTSESQPRHAKGEAVTEASAKGAQARQHKDEEVISYLSDYDQSADMPLEYSDYSSASAPSSSTPQQIQQRESGGGSRGFTIASPCLDQFTEAVAQSGAADPTALAAEGRCTTPSGGGSAGYHSGAASVLQEVRCRHSPAVPSLASKAPARHEEPCQPPRRLEDQGSRGPLAWLFSMPCCKAANGVAATDASFAEASRLSACSHKEETVSCAAHLRSPIRQVATPAS